VFEVKRQCSVAQGGGGAKGGCFHGCSQLRLWYEWRAHVERREDRWVNKEEKGGGGRGAYAGQGGCSTGNKGQGGSKGDLSACKDMEGGGGPYGFQNELGSSHCIYMP
jgi:hypothetical protein